MNIPKILFKYQSFSELSIRNLKEQSIYFGSPSNFNDPYDCALPLIVAHQSPKELETFRANQLQREDMPNKFKQELEGMSSTQTAKMLERLTDNLYGERIEKFRVGRGVSCFSETNDNLLMWSHYSGGGTGFCLEFNTNYEPFSKLVRVNYSRNFPELNPVKILDHDNADFVKNTYATKSQDWSYEREWRVIHDKAGTNHVYEPSALTGIYFGTEVHPSSLEIVCLIIQGQNPNVKFYKGSRSLSEYRVDFEEFHYTSYFTAQQKGLAV